MGGSWVADTEPNERFPLYTRGNTGEVFPNVITVLTATLIGDSIRKAQTQLIVDMGVLRPHEAAGPTVSTGVFGGYLYMNASTMRLFGVRMPGMSADSTDEQVTGAPGLLPPYQRQEGDRNLLATIAIARRSASILRNPDLDSLDAARRDAAAWAATMPDLTTASDAELIEWVSSYRPRVAASMQRLLDAGLVCTAPLGILDRMVAARGRATPGIVNRMVGGTGDVDSAQPARRLWEISRLVAGDDALTAAFDEGLVGIEARTADTALAPAMASFLADHGHRGNDEYELATPAWVMDPRPVYASLDRLRHVPDDRDPERTTARLRADADAALAEALQIAPRPLRGLVRRAATVARLGGIARERAKDVLVFENLAARRVLRKLVGRAAQRGGPADPKLGFCVTFDELPHYLEDPTSFAGVIAERSARERYLNERVPPYWFEREIPDPSTWELKADAHAAAPVTGSQLSGIPVSGGQASGRARVITDPADPRGLEPGEVLVCAITDPSWTPLFLAACAVVCDTGAMQSHAAIVARELGIPAVMSVNDITSVADGTVLSVDGDRGTVTVG